MNHIDRETGILRHLECNQTITVGLAMEFSGASPATIRRDFSRLVRQGKAERFHGGLRRIAGFRPETSFASREMIHAGEKDRIARRAAELIRPADVLMVDGGT
jgi:DeoR/GlpR family transcriptional regulator of sugar metabolism